MRKILFSLLISLLVAGQAFAQSTFTGTRAASTVNPRTCDGNVCAVVGSYTVTAAPVAGDVYQMVRVPAGATILDMVLQTTDLDTAGPAIVFDVGDGAVTDRFIDACLTGQVAANDVACRINQQVGQGYAYTAEDTIDVIVATGPTTGATSGTINLTVFYTMQGLQS